MSNAIMNMVWNFQLESLISVSLVIFKSRLAKLDNNFIFLETTEL